MSQELAKQVVGLIGEDWQMRPNSHYVAVAYAPLDVMMAGKLETIQHEDGDGKHLTRQL